MTDNIQEATDVVSFHLEEDPKAPYIVLRATGRGYTDGDLSAISSNILANTGITVSGRFVPESEHGRAGETIVEFKQITEGEIK